MINRAKVWVDGELASFAAAVPPPEAFGEMRAYEGKVDNVHINLPCRFAIEDGKLVTCDFASVCYREPGTPTENNDCSYVRAFRTAVDLIHSARELPEGLEFFVSPADVDLEDYVTPVFTRTRPMHSWNILAPFEWQLEPRQCRRSYDEAVVAGVNNLWDSRTGVALWRGSNSNCFTAACNAARASRQTDPAALAVCAAHRPLNCPDHILPRSRCDRSCHWSADNFTLTSRGRLVMLSAAVRHRLDARFTGFSETIEERLVRRFDDFGWMADFIAVRQLGQYKFHVVVEGNCAPDRIYWLMMMGSVVIFQEQPWRQWLDTVIQPWVHYVPTKYDLSDLVENLEWLQSHDEEAEAIANRGRTFARRQFGCDVALLHMEKLLRGWHAAREQDPTPEIYIGTKRVLTGRHHYTAYAAFGIESAELWEKREARFYEDFKQDGLDFAFGNWILELADKLEPARWRELAEEHGVSTAPVDGESRPAMLYYLVLRLLGRVAPEVWGLTVNHLVGHGD